MTKILYAAVRFIFGLCGFALHMHVLPYFKKIFIFYQLCFASNSKLRGSRANVLFRLDTRACERGVQGEHRTRARPQLKWPGRVQVFALSFDIAP